MGTAVIEKWLTTFIPVMRKLESRNMVSLAENVTAYILKTLGRYSEDPTTTARKA